MIRTHFTGFTEVYQQSKSSNNTIIFAVVSHGIRDMVMNFYFTAILKNNLTNLLFIAFDEEICAFIDKRVPDNTVTCHYVNLSLGSTEVSQFGSSDYLAQIHCRLGLVLDMLTHGYTVLLVDVDIVFIQNPSPYLKAKCDQTQCDLLMQDNYKKVDSMNDTGHRQIINGGFIYVRPSTDSIRLYSDIVEDVKNQKKAFHDQHLLQKHMRRLSDRGNLKAVFLDRTKFPVGTKGLYFDKLTCRSPTHTSAIIVHNNYLFRMNDKALRFKDCGLWEYDGEYGGYYTSKDARFIQFQPCITKTNNTAMILRALYNLMLLAKMNDRVAVLPMLWKHHALHSYSFAVLRSIFNDTDPFFKAGFEIRESIYLENKLVPKDIKTSTSKIYCLWHNSECSQSNNGYIDLNVALQNDTSTFSKVAYLLGKDEMKVLRIYPVFDILSTHIYAKYLSTEQVKVFEQSLALL